MTDTALTDLSPLEAMRSIIQRIATGPELSKNLSLEETCYGMEQILQGHIDPAQAAIFLIALRMKRETDDENKGILQAIRNNTQRVTAKVDHVIDIADPYNGNNRTLSAAPFLPAVLGALGCPTISHGLDSVSPKHGLTYRHIFQAAGIPVDLTPQQAADKLSKKDIGWAYIDQAQFCPQLHDLVDFRTLVVKRTALTTVEVMAGPIQGQLGTHLVTGYVHKPYARVYAMLARHAGFDSALIVRGTEGGIIPSLRQKALMYYYHDQGEEHSFEVLPQDLGIEQPLRANPIPNELSELSSRTDSDPTSTDHLENAAKLAADAGIQVLNGKKNSTRDAIIYGAALILWQQKRYPDVQSASQAVTKTIDSGLAKAHFEKAQQPS
jgi:anthranilate phosphoribosyltransferase